jgi:hypothetical protein
MTQTSHAALLGVAVSERDHSNGLSDAPVTLVEYGDFECPFCGMAYPDIKRIQSRLGDELRFVYRHFSPPGTSPCAQRRRGGRSCRGPGITVLLGNARPAL